MSMMFELLIADADAHTAQWLARCLDNQVTVRAVTSVTDALNMARAGQYAALVVGQRLNDGPGTELLRALEALYTKADTAPPVLTINDAPVQPATTTQVYYDLKPMMQPDDVRALILSAISRTAVSAA